MLLSSAVQGGYIAVQGGYIPVQGGLVPHKVWELAISYFSLYRSDYDAVKSKVGLLDQYIPTSYKASL